MQDKRLLRRLPLSEVDLQNNCECLEWRKLEALLPAPLKPDDADQSEVSKKIPREMRNDDDDFRLISNMG